MTVVPDLAEPVAGWRAWRVGDGVDGPVLVSPLRHQSWGYRTPTSATCVAGCAPCPSRGCRCGLYAMNGPGDLPLGAGGPTVLGCVALWGQVVEHRHGWRGEHGYPLVLLVLSAWWPEPPAARRTRAWLAGRDHEEAPAPSPEDPDTLDAVARELARLYSVPVHPAPALAGPDGLYAAPPDGAIADAVRLEAVTGLVGRREGDPEARARLDRRVQDLIGSIPA